MTFNEYYRSIQPVFLFFVAVLSNRSFLSNTVYYLVFGNCVRWPVRLSSSQRGFFIVSRISQHPCLLSTFIVEKQAETRRDTLTCNNLVTRAICVFLSISQIFSILVNFIYLPVTFPFLGSLIAKEVDYKRSIGLLPAASTGTLSLNL